MSKMLHGESKSVTLTDIDEFVNLYEMITEGYSAEDIFNIDETGLYVKI